MNPLQIEPNNPQWVQWVKSEAQKVIEDESQAPPNPAFIQELMDEWRVNRPKMWRRLRGATLAKPLAIILQDRYWKAYQQNKEAGMSRMDAKEQAMAGWLMMGPEDDPESHGSMEE